MASTSKLHEKNLLDLKIASQLHRASQPVLFTFHEIESWQRDNEYLFSKYRSISNSYRKSLLSLFYLHNQTGNIYSHLIPAVAFLAYAFHTYELITTRYSTADVYDILAFGVFIGSAIICFGISATFHVFGNHSSKVYHTWLLLDLYGIFVLIAGTVYSGTYYGFYCERGWWAVYSVGITAIVTTAATFCSLPRFRTPKWRWVRATLFCAIGWSGAFPMTHAAQTFGIEQANRQMGWWYFIVEGLSYITGAIIYALRMPERFRPGLFDVWGCSHQIFHICAVGGAAFHLMGLLKAFDYNHDPMTRRC
ncbi:HlyIII-domain-containing protein [Ophiobolus disseminans]|uniref:HlyIII-domain-containing protein n=1 Tax=Ophiobolus disseminans TaxID=1469910 RepID=A0A6A6ZRT2_9PLEO|nr:HlyIII-domain-containing protein [Ophiobolus disseminans]